MRGINHRRFAVELIYGGESMGVAHSYPFRFLARWRARYEQRWDARLGQDCGTWTVTDLDAANDDQEAPR